jgi:uncharacterized membrane protein
MDKQIEKKLIISGFIISFIAVLMNLVWDFILPGGVASPIVYNVIMGCFMTAFAYIHSKRYLGLFKTNTLFIATAVISLTMEYFGVVTSNIYGEYHYGTIYGPKLFETVPYIIPISWFLFLYPAVIITNEILPKEKSIVSLVKKGSGVVQIIIFAAFDSLVMTALDLLIDPVWTSRGSWFWTGLDKLRPEEILYKIPIQNYFGWLMTTFLIFIIFRTVFFMKKDTYEEKDNIYFLPVFNYIAIFIVGSIEAWILLKSQGVIFVAVMTLGLISLIMTYKMYEFYKKE